MKKILRKLRKSNLGQEPGSSRITNDTVAEHREKILAGGKKFKYPLQYARHKLVINAILISLVTVIAFVTFGWLQLYTFQSTSDFMYRITRVIPVPVAYIDGQPVLYSDYLMRYRSSVHYLEKREQVNLSSEEGKIQLALLQNQALDSAITDALATKLARELDITVTDSELEAFLKQQRQTADGEVSEQSSNASVMDYYNWSVDEYRHAMKLSLLRQKVTYAYDTAANKLAQDIKAKLTSDTDLKKITESYDTAVGYGVSGRVPKNNQDGGLSAAAAKLKQGEVSGLVAATTGEGYYYIRLLEITDTQVRYEYIHIPITAFSAHLESLKSQNKLQLLIKKSEV